MGKYLVTGGLGFIGSHIVEELHKQGHYIDIIDDGSLGILKNVSFRDRRIKVNYNTTENSIYIINSNEKQLIEKYKKYDGIFHLGMPSSSPMYKNNPELVGKTINDWISILELAKENECPVVYASTSSLYNGNIPTFTETQHIKPTDYYTECRYAIERFARMYHDVYNISSIGLRLFSVYGDREEHKGEYANIITQMKWMKERNDKKSLLKRTFKPEKFKLYAKTTMRDFIHVNDVTNSFLESMKYLLNHKKECEIYNIGTETAISLEHVANLIGLSISYTKKNPIKNYIPFTLADSRKAQRAKILTNKFITVKEHLKRG